MTARTAYVPVAGTAITAANHIKFPGGWIGYAEVTANQGTFTTETDLTSLTESVTVGASRRIRITACVQLQSSVDNDLCAVFIKEGSTYLSTIQLKTATSQTKYIGQVVLTPSTGSHTYKLSATRSVGTGNITMNASSTSPAFILIEDLGPSS